MKYLVKHFLFVFLSLCLACTSYAQTYRWARGGGTPQSITSSGGDWEGARYMCTDPNGNVYVLSTTAFMTPLIADTFYLAGPAGPDRNFFLSSYDCSGNMRWAKFIGSQNNTYVESIIADSLGHVYVAGQLAHIAGAHTLRIGYDTVLSAVAYQTAGLIQFDTNGHFNWIRYAGDNTPSSQNASSGPLVLDGNNNVHMILNTGYGVHILPTLTSHWGCYDLTYTPSGTLSDVKTIDIDSVWSIHKAVLDPVSKKLYVVGEIRQFIYGPAVPAGLTDAFYAAAFDSDRNQLWMSILDTPAGVNLYYLTSIVKDGHGHLYFSGGAQTNKFKYRSDSVVGIGNMAVVMKTDTNGNRKWIQHIDVTGSSVNSCPELTLLPNNQIAVIGYFAGTLWGDGHSFSSYGGEGWNVYFSILDTSRHIFSIQQLHGSAFYDKGNTITSNKKGDIFWGGEVGYNIWGGTMTPFTSTGGNTDFFILKYGVDCNCSYLPVANFSSTGTRTVNFTYSGTTTGIDSVRWTFGDGGTSTALNPTHIYLCSGTFSACIRVYTACGSDMHCSDIIIPSTFTPGASFTYTGVSSLAFTYTGPTVGADSIRWSFGDGGVSSVTNPTHTYMAVGTYTVCARAYWMCMVDSFCVTVTVPCVSAPVVTFNSTGAGPTRNFNYTGSTTGVTSITWDYGDGSGTGSGTPTSHTYGAPGIYTVCVTATSPCGSNVICATVNVTCMVAPTASFTKSGSMGSRSFTYTGTLAGVDSVGWDFGDGGHATGTTPSHSYATTGIFTVCVTAYSQCGNSVWCDTVNIPCLSVPSVTFTGTGALHDSTKNFTYTGSMSGVDSVRWDFGDGEGFTGTTAIHSYSDTGTYTVCAIAYSQCGNDTTCTTVIYRLPVGIAVISAANILVYPNPANGQLVIEHAAGCEMKVCDVVGRCVLRGVIRGEVEVVDVSGLEGGVYVVVFSSESGVRVMRVVKK